MDILYISNYFISVVHHRNNVHEKAVENPWAFLIVSFIVSAYVVM